VSEPSASTESTAIARVEQAHRLLAQARTFDEVKNVRDLAAAAALYAKEAHYSEQIIANASEIKVRAERKAGELLATMPKNEGTKGQLTGDVVVGGHVDGPPTDPTPTLKDLGITKNQSAQWQEIARTPVEIFEAALAEARSASTTGLVTTGAVQRKAEEKIVERVMETVGEVVPGAAERLATAKMKTAVATAILQVSRHLLCLDPDACMHVVEQRDLVDFRRFLGELETWVAQARLADAQSLGVIK
jgi:hypothetical protein